jgi:hypothetical protein
VVEIDTYAKEVAIRRWALPPCLHIPIAARDECAIETYIGRIHRVLSPGKPNRALLVDIHETPELNERLPIWRLKEAAVLHYHSQVWVHVDYSGYRKAYIRAFLAQNLSGLVIDHVMNRRVARLKGFEYLRVIPISREANSSSGGLSEKWAVAQHKAIALVEQNRQNPAFIQYADLADIVKMLNMKTGGALQDPVNEAQAIVR